MEAESWTYGSDQSPTSVPHSALSLPTPEEERQLLTDRCRLLSWAWSHRRPGHCQVEKVNVEKQKTTMEDHGRVRPMAASSWSARAPCNPNPSIAAQEGAGDQASACQLATLTPAQGPTFRLRFPSSEPQGLLPQSSERVGSGELF